MQRQPRPPHGLLAPPPPRVFRVVQSECHSAGGTGAPERRVHVSRQGPEAARGGQAVNCAARGSSTRAPLGFSRFHVIH